MEMREQGFASGVDEVSRRLKRLAFLYPEAFKAAAFTVMSLIVSHALPSVPVVSGDLKRSRFVAKKHPVVGGFGAWYAARVHELDGKRGWKFFQRALADLLPDVAPLMASLTEKYANAGITLANVPAVHPRNPSKGGAKRKKKKKETRR